MRRFIVRAYDMRGNQIMSTISVEIPFYVFAIECPDLLAERLP